MTEEKLNSENIDPLVMESSVSSESIEREKWDRKIESILSMLGFCVGLGNVWRFPYLCMRNGGGAFLIPFVFFLLLCGLPLYFLEVSAGQFSGKGIVKVWDVCPLFRGVGFGICILSTISCSYYIVIISWTLYYLGNSFKNPLPWSSCGAVWNTPMCNVEKNEMSVFNNVTQDNVTYMYQNMTNLTYTQSIASGYVLNNETKFLTSEEEFWQYNVLHISEGLEQIGNVQWHLALCFLASWVLVFLCIVKGIKSVGKVVYVTATLPYILLFVILIRGLTLPGAIDGVIYYIKPNFYEILRPQVWVEAAIQIFYSSGIVWGALITMASYNKFNNNCLRDSVCLIIAGEGTSIFGGFVVFSILGFMAHEAKLTIPEVVKSGPGLGFIAYPDALTMLPLPNLWGVMFFLMLLTVGLDSTFGTIEPVCTALTDSYPILRKRRVLFTAVLCAVCFLAALPMVCEGGIYIFQLLDWYSASFAVPLFGLLECIVFGWVYGAEMFSRDIELMLGRGVPVVMRICWCFITPSILLIILIATMVVYKPPTYGQYQYPPMAEVIGWIIALLPVIPIPIVACLTVINAEGATLGEKFRNSIRPTQNWLPNQKMDSKVYHEQDRTYHGNVIDTVLVNITGRPK